VYGALVVVGRCEVYVGLVVGGWVYGALVVVSLCVVV